MYIRNNSIYKTFIFIFKNKQPDLTRHVDYVVYYIPLLTHRSLFFIFIYFLVEIKFNSYDLMKISSAGVSSDCHLKIIIKF